MIHLTASAAFMIYLSATLAVVLGVWLYQHLNPPRMPIVNGERELKLCEYCQHVYLDGEAAGVSQCPQCASYNRDNRYTKPD
jgi:uncharacterized paraquat-inducible protein A